ncbi:MAG: GNAT family N-acetyltransferase [Candidatus Adiutrix sp.]|jgi:predicted N-acetyltransferase YhbS|nr:GNAT family N-acetyltransferase [Candidatus Adiutrix sp.]
MNLRFSLLPEDGGESDRRNFSCGAPELDTYLHRQAGQDVARGFATVVLARAIDEPAVIVGYYAFSAASVPIVSLPVEISGKMPRYRNVPAILLGRLAVALSMRSRRIGSLLLFDALKRACVSEIAWAIFMVEAKNERAAAFYEKFGFLRFHQAAHSLWVTRKQAESLIRA